MPPPGNPQPDRAEVDALDRDARDVDRRCTRRQQVGYVAAQRLSRTEYAHAVKDAARRRHRSRRSTCRPRSRCTASRTSRPRSASSPAFVEQYVTAASAVAHLAVGEPKPKVAQRVLPSRRRATKTRTSPACRSARAADMKFTHTFPADGEYRITLTDLGVGLYPRAVETRQTLVVLVDRNEQFRGDIGGEEDLALIDPGGAPARAEIMKRFADIPLQGHGRHSRGRRHVHRALARGERRADRRRSRARLSFERRIARGRHRRRRQHGGAVQLDGPSRTRRAAASCSSASPRSRTASTSAPSRSRRISRAARSPAREPRRSRSPHAVLRGRAQGRGRLRRRHRAHDDRRALEPRLPLSLDRPDDGCERLERKS